jgi:hypothetical protein
MIETRTPGVHHYPNRQTRMFASSINSGRYGQYHRRPALTAALAGPCLLLTATTAFAVDLLSPINRLFGGGDDQIVWQEQGQFVKIVDQDFVAGRRRPPRNAHPANVPAGELGAVLASLRVAGGTALFTRAQAGALAAPLSDALSRATSKQDVVFAVANVHDKAGPDRRYTAARVFMAEGRLNFIFGDVMSPAGRKSSTSHFAKPHRAGRRAEIVESRTSLSAGSGISHQSHYDRPRPDWIRVDVAAVVAAQGGPVRVAAPAAAAAVPAQPSAAPADDSMQALQQRRQMLEEMARMRKEQREAGPATESPAHQPAVSAAPEAPISAAADPVEQRLSRLRNLHDKKLITDQEYEAKRREILEDL